LKAFKTPRQLFSQAEATKSQALEGPPYTANGQYAYSSCIHSVLMDYIPLIINAFYPTLFFT